MNIHAAPVPRELPQNLAVEQALLGAVIVNNAAFDRVSDFLEPAHFFEPIHQQIYEVVAKLLGSRKKATPSTIMTFLPVGTKIGGATLPQYVAHLAAEAVTIVNAEDFGRAIYDLAMRRMLIRVGEDVLDIAYDSPVDLSPSEQITLAVTRLEALGAGAADGDPTTASISLKDSIVKALQHAEAAAQQGNGAGGLSTGLIDLDRMTGGFGRGELILVGGRPSMGKSALAGCFARAAARAGIGVGVISLEMAHEAFSFRMLTDEAFDRHGSIPYQQIARGQYGALRKAIEDAAVSLSRLPLALHDRGGMSISGITAMAKAWHRKMLRDGNKLGLLIVDYIGLVRASDRYRGDRNNEVSEVSAALKGLAKTLDIPIVALSQLSRAVETREDKRPMLSDLRDSGSLEQDADKVIFLYREHYYLSKQSKGDVDRDAMLAHTEHTLEAIVAKNRMGPTGTVRLFFDLPASAVRNIDNRDMF